MNCFNEISLDDPSNAPLLENQSYQNYLREHCSTNDNNISKKRIKKILSSKVFYSALNQLPTLEKKVFYLAECKNESINYICKKLHLSKKEVTLLRKKAIKHFIDNVNAINGDSNNEWHYRYL